MVIRLLPFNDVDSLATLVCVAGGFKTQDKTNDPTELLVVCIKAEQIITKKLVLVSGKLDKEPLLLLLFFSLLSTVSLNFGSS